MATIDTIRSDIRSEGRAERDGGAVALLRRLGAAIGWLDDRFEKRRSRHALLELSDYQLKDIGLSRADAFNEARRRFWD